MKVTRDVILDIWPVYEAGEASADTRALVEAFLAEDPEFARLIREERRELMTQPAPALTPDKEIETLLATQRLLARRMQYLTVALLFTVVPMFLRLRGLLDVGGLELGRLLLLAIGVCGWVGLWRTHRRLRATGL